MGKDGKCVQVWFSGASTTRDLRADGCMVGPLGELKLFIGHEFVTIIAPGQWVFINLTGGEGKG